MNGQIVVANAFGRVLFAGDRVSVWEDDAAPDTVREEVMILSELPDASMCGYPETVRQRHRRARPAALPPTLRAPEFGPRLVPRVECASANRRGRLPLELVG